MEPFKRFKKSNTENNLWIYILSLGKEREIARDEVGRLIFERFGFLPGKILISRVLYRLRTQGYIQRKRFKGKLAFSTTKKGLTELEKMKKFSQDLIEKL
jgi:hypothetical protein